VSVVACATNRFLAYRYVVGAGDLVAA